MPPTGDPQNFYPEDFRPTGLQVPIFADSDEGMDDTELRLACLGLAVDTGEPDSLVTAKAFYQWVVGEDE